ncbi:hypothetical protein FB451DRAFT_1341052 [Mycena latifolia]|nr:hypothetical protein FB451DRAFT_1341052 [Mycena latifolia]
MKCGAFPCVPIQPSLAVDLRVLEFCKNLFLQIAPNNTAFTTTLERCLSSMGFQLQHQRFEQNSLRRRFSNCLMWYIHLRNETKERYGNMLEVERLRYLGDPATSSSPARRDTSPPGASSPVPPTSPTPAARRCPAQRRRDARSASSLPVPQPRKREREETPDPPPHTRPSEYLRRQCPACFGALKRDNSLRPNYSKRANAKAGRDPPRSHPKTHFVPEDDATHTEAYVDSIRQTHEQRGKRHKAMVDALDEEEEDGYNHPLLRLPRSVMDGCEASFKAADETHEKASTRFFEDTAIMGLLCRHDRVLWLVNMHSTGEKQFYVVVLLETLFQELPPDIRVGLLYDVVCSFEQSCRKWGFLSRFMDRLVFAVSLLYHPRKRVGFGFSDGEGCKRFWHSISHLIANLWISGYHNRLYTLDMQIEHADEASLTRLGEWIRRRHYHSAKKRSEAQGVLLECGQPIALLRAQWALQVKTQTKPLPRRSKNKGQQAVNAVILMHGALKARETQLEKLRQSYLDAVMEEDPSAPLHEVAFDSANEAFTKAEAKLRQKEGALGVSERQALRGLVNSDYMRLRMNARALKRRLWDRLRSRKFELDKVEHSFRWLVNDQKLYSHTESAVKRREPTISKLNADYNKLCAIPPLPIPAKGIWQLDVDDGIWQDVGLDDDDAGGNGAALPPWLADEQVWAGIKAMLELDRCGEEDARLKKERCALQEWFAEEWAIVNPALERAELGEDKYQLQLLRDNQKSLPDLGVEEAGLPPWGPSAAQLVTCIVDAHVVARGEDRHYVSDEDDEEDSGHEEEDFGTLDAVETADIYRSAQEDNFFMY